MSNDPWDAALEDKPGKASIEKASFEKASIEKASFQSPVLAPASKPIAPEGYVSVFVRGEWKVVPAPKLSPQPPPSSPMSSLPSSIQTPPTLSASGLKSLAASFRESAHNHGASGMRDVEGDTAAFKLEEAAYSAKRAAQERRMAAFNGVQRFGTRK
jgi:hypothetical protein